MSASKRMLVIVVMFLLVCAIASMLFVFKRHETVYPTKISVVNVPREIELTTDNYLVFDQMPYQTTPSNSNEDVEIALTDYNSRPTANASFDNLTFRSDVVGSYYLQFKTQNKYGKVLQDAIKIKVVQPVDAQMEYIKILNGFVKTEICEPVCFDDVVETANETAILNYYEDGQPLSSSCLFKDAGQHCVMACICHNGYKKCTDISVLVKSSQKGELSVFDKQGNILSTMANNVVRLQDTTILLTYKTNNIDDQEVQAECVGESMELLSIDAPILCIKLNKKGKSTLTIKYRDIVQKYIFEIV